MTKISFAAPEEVPLEKMLKGKFHREVKRCDFKAAYKTLKKLKVDDREYYFLNSLALLKTTLHQSPVNFDRELWRDEILENRCQLDRADTKISKLPPKPLDTIIQYGVLNYGRFSFESKSILRRAMYYGMEQGVNYPAEFFSHLPRQVNEEACELSLLAEKSHLKVMSIENKVACEKIEMNPLFIKMAQLDLADYYLARNNASKARYYYNKLGAELDLIRKTKLAIIEDFTRYLKLMENHYKDFEQNSYLVELGRKKIESMSYLDLKKYFGHLNYKGQLKILSFYASDAMFFYLSDILKKEKKHRKKLIEQLIRIAIRLRSPSLMSRSLEYRKTLSLKRKLVNYLIKWPDQKLLEIADRKRKLRETDKMAILEALKRYPAVKNQEDSSKSKINPFPVVSFPANKLKI